MKLFAIFFLTVFTTLAGADRLDGFYIQNGCQIHLLTGEKILSLPGSLCVFGEDGSVITGLPSGLHKINADMSIAWTLRIPVHHQINLTEDKKSVLTLSSKFEKVGGVPVRDDRFLQISLNGEIEKDVSIGSLLPDEKLTRLPSRGDFPGFEEHVTERSHFNSIFEIPDVPARADAPWLKRGNIIVNSLHIGVLVLSPDMKKILHSFVYADSWAHQVHDVKVLSSGNILLFNNHQRNQATSEFSNSNVLELDPVSLKPVFAYGNDKKPYFFAGARSGAHEIDKEHLAFSLEWQGVYVISKKNKKIIYANHSVNRGQRGISSNQEVRILKLEKFLAHHKKDK